MQYLGHTSIKISCTVDLKFTSNWMLVFLFDKSGTLILTSRTPEPLLAPCWQGERDCVQERA